MSTKKLIAIAFVVGIPTVSFAMTAVPTLIFKSYFAKNLSDMLESAAPMAKHKRELSKLEQSMIVHEVESMKAIEVDISKHEVRMNEILWVGSDVAGKAEMLGTFSDYMAIKTGDATVTIRSASDGHELAKRDNKEQIEISR